MNELTTRMASYVTLAACVWSAGVFLACRLWRAPRPRRRVVPGLGVATVVSAIVAWFFFAYAAQSATFAIRGDRGPVSAVLAAGIAGTLLVGLLLPLLHESHVALRQVGWHLRHWPAMVWFGLALLVFWAPLVLAANAWIRLLVPQSTPHPVQKLFEEAQPAWAWPIVFYTVAIAAPVFEELLFRGIIQTAATRAFGPYGAIVVASLAFGVVHGTSWPDPLPIFLLGLALGYAYQSTRSLVPSIVMHAGFNAGNLLLVLLSQMFR